MKEHSLHYPAAEQLEKLEQGLAEARTDGDEDAVKGYQEALRQVISRNPLEISGEQWDTMNDEQKARFYKIKMKEARALGDKDAFDFWNANLNNLNKR